MGTQNKMKIEKGATKLVENHYSIIGIVGFRFGRTPLQMLVGGEMKHSDSQISGDQHLLSTVIRRPKRFS
jgi:hypothetical protein